MHRWQPSVQKLIQAELLQQTHHAMDKSGWHSDQQVIIVLLPEISASDRPYSLSIAAAFLPESLRRSSAAVPAPAAFAFCSCNNDQPFECNCKEPSECPAVREKPAVSRAERQSTNCQKLFAEASLTTTQKAARQGIQHVAWCSGLHAKQKLA